MVVQTGKVVQTPFQLVPSVEEKREFRYFCLLRCSIIFRILFETNHTGT